MHHTTHGHGALGRGIIRLILLVVFADICLARCASTDDGWRALPSSQPAYFDSQCFVQEGNRVVYEDDARTIRTTGVDVSDHQGHVDWTAVASDGISFAMIRAGWRGNTEGYLHRDELFEENLAGATDAGLACGVYFYSQAVTEDEAREEARLTLEMLGSRELAYPVVFDYEPNDGNRLAGIDGTTATACAKAFCSTIESAGYRTMIYGNAYDLQFLDLSELPDHPLWFAEYGGAPSCSEPFVLWQYSSSGTVKGIATPADLNLDLSEAF